MEMTDLISIVVPVYNVAPFLPACLDSIVHQSYQNLEILLIDDGSTDSSGLICDQYAQQDTRIQVIHKSNGGLSDARNAGINIAKGQYICFVDSDDVITTDMVEYLYFLAKDQNADISTCQALLINEKGEEIAKGNPTITQNYIIQGEQACMEDFIKYPRINVVAWGKLYKTELFHKYNILYPVGKYHEDTFTTYRLVAKSQIIIVGSEAKYLYRQRAGSIMLQSFSPRHLDSIEAKIEQINFVKNNYPSLLPYVQSSLISCANTCSLRMISSGCYHKQSIAFLQPFYRRYEGSYLKYGSTHIFSKIFSICAWLSLPLSIRIGIFLKPKHFYH